MASKFIQSTYAVPTSYCGGGQDNGSGKENGDGQKRKMVKRGNNMAIYEVLERI